MKICQYEANGSSAWGIVDGDDVRALVGDPFGAFESGPLVGSVASTRLLAPCNPSKVVGVTHNHESILAEFSMSAPSEPPLFLKGPNAVVGHGSSVLNPTGADKMMYEGELAVVIGRSARQIAAEDAADYILGYTCANDISMADWRDPVPQWVKFKSSDTHCPLGPWIETELANPNDVRIRTTVNGDLRQDASTKGLIFSIGFLLSYITAHMTLMPGDVVLTGTPGGIGIVTPGDTMDISIEGIGTLTNNVIDWV